MINAFFRFFEKLLIRYLRQRRAAVAPMVGVLFPVILGMFGAGTDFSAWMHDRQNLQTAADAAAIAAAYEVLNGSEDNMEAAALKEAVNNGFLNVPDQGASIDVIYTPGEDGNPIGSLIQVTLRHPTYYWFSSLFLDDAHVSTTAGVVIDRPNEFCMLALNETAAKSLYVAGDANLSAPGCSIAANSSSDRALLLQGNYDIDVGDVELVGNYDEVGNSGEFGYGDMDTGAEPLPDPYADLEVPEFDPVTDCTSFVAPADGYISQSSGVDGDTTVFCGSDLALGSTTDWVFQPGTYILNAVDFNIAGSGTVTADGVTFILTGNDTDGYGQLVAHGSGDLIFTAPVDEDNEFAGIAFFQDRNAPYIANDPNILNGGSSVLLNGVAYFPNQPLVFGGNNSAQVPACSMVIASTIEIHGTPNMDTSCEGIPVEFIDPPTVFLSF
jgi:hypothetical protein